MENYNNIEVKIRILYIKLFVLKVESFFLYVLVACLHYITATNCGLMQGNMTWCDKNRGPDYHWIVDLYLPITSAVVSALTKANKERMANLKRKKSEKGKKTENLSEDCKGRGPRRKKKVDKTTSHSSYIW